MVRMDIAPPADAVTPVPAASSRWLRNAAIFLGAQIVSLIGSSIVGYAVIWYITLKTGSGTQYAMLLIASQLTQGLAGIPGGVWADRYSRKMLIIASISLNAAATLGLAIHFIQGHQELGLIVAILAFRGLMSGVQSPNLGASLPQLVPKQHLMRVNSLNSAAQAVIYVGAPAIAAVLITKVTLGWIFIVDVIAAVCAALLMLVVRLPRLPRVVDPAGPTGLRSYGHDIGEGLRAIGRHPGLVRGVAIFAFLQCITLPVTQMTPVFITRYLGRDQWMLAAGEICFSSGMVVGGLFMTAWGGLRNRMSLIMLASAGLTIGTVLMGASTNIWWFCAVMVLGGLTLPMLTASATTAVQENVDPAVLGRVMSLLNLVLAVAGPIGVAVFGPLADHISLRLICFVVAGATACFLLVLQLRGGPGSQLLATAAPSQTGDSEVPELA